MSLTMSFMTLAEGLHTQFQVVHALIIRETRTRYGASSLGYLWALLEPLFWVATFYGIFAYTGRYLPGGMDVTGFIATGIVPYMMFRSALTQAMQAINSNRSLLFYPQVKPLDLAIARTLLEMLTVLSVFALILAGRALVRGEWVVDQTLLLLGGFLLAWLLGASIGLAMMGLSVIYSGTQRLVNIVMRPMFFISGIFFTANELPTTLREYLLWNPVLHTVEMTRDGLFPGYTAHYVNVAYVLAWIVGFTYLGLLLERLSRSRLRLA